MPMEECVTSQREHARGQTCQGTGTEVNPESWTQLKGSNETTS